jgi:FkbM family methyltransferase
MITNALFKFLERWPTAQRQAARIFFRLPSRLRLVDHIGSSLIVDPTERTGYYLYYERSCDTEIFKLLEMLLPRYERVLDVGANIGVYTVFFAGRVPHVDAFEPVPKIVRRLKDNVELNNLTNVRIHELCISDSIGSLPFALSPHVNWGIGRIHSGDAVGGLSFESTTLDAFLDCEVREATLIKMDIEGAEWMALKGASRVFRNRKARLDVLLETHPNEIAEYGGSVTQLAEYLRTVGFKLHAVSDQGLCPLENTPNARFWFAES